MANEFEIDSHNCTDCSQCTKLKGCANGVPYLQIITSSATNSANVEFINLLNGSISAIAPVGFITGDCPIVEEPVLKLVDACEDVLGTTDRNYTFTILGNQVTITNTSTQPLNDTHIGWIVDWGNGLLTNKNNPFPQIYEYPPLANGSYTIDIYQDYRSGHRRLVTTRTIVFLNGVIQTATLPSEIQAGVVHNVPKKIQAEFDNNDVFIRFVNVDGTTYIPTGTVNWQCQPLIVREILQSDEASLFEQPSPQLTLISGGVSIAEGTFAATLGPDGVNWTNPGNLKSVTIRARRSNTTNAVTGVGNQVIINTSTIKYVLLTNEIVSYSVEDNNIQDFASVDCIGNSAALVTYNYL